MSRYFNYHFQIAANRWDRWTFLHRWYRLQTHDKQWVPPYFPILRQALNPTHNPHVARMQMIQMVVEAMPQRKQRQPNTMDEPVVFNSTFEVPVLNTAVFIDPRRRDHTAYFGLFDCVNDSETVERWLNQMRELLRGAHIARLVGPVGLSPFLGSGVLQDNWHLPPPMHTAYHPPYLAELMSHHFRTISQQRLYHIPVPEQVALDDRVALRPLHHRHLSTGLKYLFANSLDNRLGIPRPDPVEIEFLLRWMGEPAPFGWTAYLNEKIAGFVLLQADVGQHLRRLKGGRFWWHRLAWHGMKNRRVKHGRLLFGGVHPDFQHQGVGTQLLRQALQAAKERGWETLTVGPVDGRETAVSFLEKHGGIPQQTYHLYEKIL